MAGECWLRSHRWGGGSSITVLIRARSERPFVFSGISVTLHRLPPRPAMVLHHGSRRAPPALVVVRVQCDDLRRLSEIVPRAVGGCPPELQPESVRA